MIKLAKYINIEYILLFLASFELFDKHHFVFFALFAFMLLRGKIRFSGVPTRDFFWLACFGVSYVIFAGLSECWSVVQIPSWLCVFLIGYSLVESQKDFLNVLMIVAFGYALEGVLTCFMGEGLAMVEGEDSRFLFSIWGDNLRAGTAQAISLYLFSAFIPYILKQWKSVLLKIIAVSIELVFVYNAMLTASRGALLWPMVIMFVSFFVMTEHKIRTVVFLLLLGLFCFIAYQEDVFGFKSFFESQFLFTRISEKSDGGLVHNARWEFYSNIPDMLHYPWGGYHEIMRGWFHNTFLDMFAYGGIVTAFSFLFLAIALVRNSFHKYNSANKLENGIIVGMLISFFAPLLTDPLLWAAPGYFALYVFFIGCMSKRNGLIKKNLYLEKC